ncbi:MAG: biotin synthase BioB, partial [Muribaculaceae bacterium]|nr:biotin synthase BioB [Muribaculaceae bacterium]
MYTLNSIKEKVLSGKQLSDDEAYALLDFDSKELREAASEVTSRMCAPVFDSCSIINARSGRCSENCKWCAQSAHYNTKCDVYDMVEHAECMRVARYNHERGVKRFSLVASGKKVSGDALKTMCRILDDVHRNVGIEVCASMGLLDRDGLRQLKEAGVNRYHCNLETAPSYFRHLCTTHTIEDKLATIEAAHELGMEVCSGGIIGMGETPRQRIEFALTLRKARPVSIPVNVLSPIKGTPLGETTRISEDEILDTIAMIRLIHPAVQIRFA